MRTLKSVDVGRDNNLNLIRFVAASAVIFSHSWRLVTGQPGQDPIARLTGIVPGNIAVDIFFIISGYLVTKSLFSRGNVGTFILSRALRIIPALLVCTILTALVLGPFFTTLPVQEYLTKGRPYNYIFQNFILLSFGTIPYELPGVFENLPESAVVNGSLWTLTYEAWMYVTLAVAGILGLIQRRALVLTGTCFCVGLYFVDQVAGLLDAGLVRNALRFMAYFYAGTCLYLYRAVIPISWNLAAIGLTFSMLSFVVGLQAVMVPVAVCYAVFVMSFLLKGAVLKFNKTGDFSYGMYIYAYPIQQGLVALVPGIQPMSLAISAFGLTLIPAVASWFLIEKPALGLKDATVEPLEE